MGSENNQESPTLDVLLSQGRSSPCTLKCSCALRWIRAQYSHLRDHEAEGAPRRRRVGAVAPGGTQLPRRAPS